MEVIRTVIKPKKFGDIQKIAKRMNVSRGTVEKALGFLSYSQLAEEIRNTAIEDFKAIVVQTNETL